MKNFWLQAFQIMVIFLLMYFTLTVLKPNWFSGEFQLSKTARLHDNNKKNNNTNTNNPNLHNQNADVNSGFRHAVKMAAPSVVSINVKKGVPLNANHKNNSMQNNRDYWRDFFFGKNKPSEGSQGKGGRESEEESAESDVEMPHAGMGSGVIVSEDGYILTNNHVVENAENIEVLLSDGRRSMAQIIGTDPESDLAVVKINLPHLKAIVFGDSNQLQVGDAVLAIGNPFGVGQTVTSGIVSALGRNQLGINAFENFIQTDAAINPGNSGGALVDVQGNLQGINTAIYSRSGGSMGIGFAIPMATAQQIMDSIIKEGQVTRGWIGVEPQDLSPELAEYFGIVLPTNPDDLPFQAVILTGILHNGPADKAGFIPGDVLVKLGTQTIHNTADLLSAVAKITPGSATAAEVLRNNQRLSLQIFAGTRPRPLQVVR